LSSFDLPETCA
jgi:hypothetical protein